MTAWHDGQVFVFFCYLHAVFLEQFGEVFGERLKGSNIMHGHIHEDNVEPAILARLYVSIFRK